MSDPPQEPFSDTQRTVGCTITVGLVAIVIVMVSTPLQQALSHLLLGGFRHLWDSLPHLLPEPLSVAGLLVLIGVTLLLLHFVIDLITARREPEDTPSPWRWAWTIKGMLLALILFAASCATIGVAHHAGWMFRSRTVVVDTNRSPITKGISNCRQVITYLRIYASDHTGQYPDTLEELLAARELELSPDDWQRINHYYNALEGMKLPWVYLTGLTDSDYGTLPLVFSSGPINRKGSYILGMNDSSVAVATPEEFDAAMADYRAHMKSKPSPPASPP